MVCTDGGGGEKVEKNMAPRSVEKNVVSAIGAG
jgi:hypothetical protein